MSGTMLSAFIGGKEDIDLREVPVPSPGPGEVLVREPVCAAEAWRPYGG